MTGITSDTQKVQMRLIISFGLTMSTENLVNQNQRRVIAKQCLKSCSRRTHKSIGQMVILLPSHSWQVVNATWERQLMQDSKSWFIGRLKENLRLIRKITIEFANILSIKNFLEMQKFSKNSLYIPMICCVLSLGLFFVYVFFQK